VSGEPIDHDELLARLRRRAADPQRRTTERPSQFAAQTRSMDFGSLLSMLGSVSSDLDRVVAANRSGLVDPAGSARAQAFDDAMRTPASSSLPEPATPAALSQAEAVIGTALPPVLRRAYLEIADGGFGPGEGLLSLDEVIAARAELQRGEVLPRGRRWPDGLIPVVDHHPGFTCVETTSGRVLDWDPEGLSERSSEARFLRSFREEASSVEAWLDHWASSRTVEERMADVMRQSQIDGARRSRAEIAKKTPEERAQMGLPEVGWEKVVWGGIGLDEDDDPPA
jgi:hypothetical protein